MIMAKLDVDALKSALTSAGASWIAAETAMTALSNDEMRLRLGAEPPVGEAALFDREQAATATLKTARSKAAAAAAAAWDWRSVGGANYLAAPRDQKTCGSCVAFGTIAAIEGTTRFNAKNAGLNFDLSEAHLFYCHGAADGRNCGNGWWPSKALDAAKAKGIVDEACFPYVPGDQACKPCVDAVARTTKIKSWTSLQNAEAMKTWISTKGPVVACFTVYSDFQAYHGGIYRHVSGDQLGGHCVCVVGYSDADKAWIARNSWGPGWGEGGYFRIGYGEVGIDYEMWGVDVDAKPVVNDVIKLEKVQITGLWANNAATMTQAYVDKLGWRKLPSADFVTLAATARTARAPCTISIKGDTIIELYVM